MRGQFFTQVDTNQTNRPTLWNQIFLLILYFDWVGLSKNEKKGIERSLNFSRFECFN